MKYLVLALLILLVAINGRAQTPFIITRDVFRPTKPTPIEFPIFGVYKLEGSGSDLYKNLSVWVLDKNGNELFYLVHGMPAREEYFKFMNKEYIEFMLKHGRALYRTVKRELNPLTE